MNTKQNIFLREKKLYSTSILAKNDVVGETFNIGVQNKFMQDMP